MPRRCLIWLKVYPASQSSTIRLLWLIPFPMSLICPRVGTSTPLPTQLGNVPLDRRTTCAQQASQVLLRQQRPLLLGLSRQPLNLAAPQRRHAVTECFQVIRLSTSM